MCDQPSIAGKKFKGMKNNHKIESEVVLIMQSEKKSSNIKASPFFINKVMSKIENIEETNPSVRLGYQLVKIAAAVLVLVNVINFSLFHKSSQLNNNEKELMEIVQQEYAHIYADFMLTEEFIVE
jgi:hypothetical protein